jgi:hypothetical protein
MVSLRRSRRWAGWWAHTQALLDNNTTHFTPDELERLLASFKRISNDRLQVRAPASEKSPRKRSSTKYRLTDIGSGIVTNQESLHWLGKVVWQGDERQHWT